VGIHVGAVDVGHEGDGSFIGIRVVAGTIRSRRSIAAIHRRIRPVQGLIDRQQVGQTVAVWGNQIIDPPDADRDVGGRLHGVGRVVELGARIRRDRRHRIRRRPVAPHGRRRKRIGPTVDRVPDPARKDLLLELPDRDVVAVNRSVVVHHRRDDQRRYVLRDRGRVQRPARRGLRERVGSVQHSPSQQDGSQDSKQDSCSFHRGVSPICLVFCFQRLSERPRFIGMLSLAWLRFLDSDQLGGLFVGPRPPRCRPSRSGNDGHWMA
jgi:hypothetical protein